MFNIGQIVFPLKAGQQASTNLQCKINDYMHTEQKLFALYSSLQAHLLTGLANETEESGDFTYDARSFVLFLINSLDEMEVRLSDEISTISEASETILGYINSLSTSRMQEYREHLEESFKHVEHRYSQAGRYSFGEAAKLLKSRLLSFNDAIKITKCLYFAHDYLNIKSVIEIRKYIIANYSDDIIRINELPQHPGRNILSLIFSDKTLLPEILIFYQIFMSDNHNSRINFNFKSEDGLDKEGFVRICLFGYCRYFLGVLIAAIQCDYSDTFENKAILQYLLNVYRRFGFFLITSFYREMTVFEALSIPSSIILDDACTQVSIFYKSHQLTKSHALVSAIARDSALEDFTAVISQIGQLALEEWQKGSSLSHIQMLKKFKESRKFGGYFAKRGFERNLKKYLIELCRKHEIRRIAGIDIPARKK